MILRTFLFDTGSMQQTSRREFCKAIPSGLALAAPAYAQQPGGVLLEAPAFVDHGGWVLDQQSIDRIGSSYLLAHGCGRPVQDAVTVAEFASTGEYYLFVRTRDWVGPWKGANVAPELRAEGSPGVFRLLIEGEPVETIFGAEGADWHWEPGGAIRISKKKVTVAIRDLTGFDGRCAAVFFSRTANPTLPDAPDEVRAWRSRLMEEPVEPASAGRFDFVVTGGGVAGLCAAVAAARHGLKVALLHNRPVLGGNSSSEIRVSPSSVRNIEPYIGLGSILGEFDWNRTVEPPQARVFQNGDEARLKLVRGERNISLFLNHHVYRVEKAGAAINAVYAQHVLSGVSSRFEGAFFADCTGDANLGFLAGAHWRMGREGRPKTGEARAPDKADGQVIGSTLHWYSRTTGKKTPFPDLPWALPFTEEKCQFVTEGGWNWETGFHLDQVNQTELIRDYKLRAIFGNWAYQKNKSERKDWYTDLELAWAGYVLGKRESRRLMGDLVYSQKDLDAGTEYPDGCIACNWGIDIHVPDPKNQKQFAGWAFRAVAEHYDKGRAPMRWLPYRCLYSRNVPNLFMAGRNASCTHVAFAWFRTQRTTAMMGEAIGLAAALCIGRKTTPRGVYAEHLNEYKEMLKKGAGKVIAGSPKS